MNEHYDEALLKELFMSISDLIKKTERQFNNIERQVLQQKPQFDEKHITPSQLFILRVLWLKDGFPLKYLATAAKCSRSTMTGIIDTMEKNGLVSRVSNPKDGRSILVKLTEMGKDLKDYTPPLDIYLLNHCKNFSKEELQMLELLLKKFLKSLEA
ncbi:MAG: MarR family winged helix-turn-helix transcriptional regulator [Promethearchaeota archaeon]